MFEVQNLNRTISTSSLAQYLIEIHFDICLGKVVFENIFENNAFAHEEQMLHIQKCFQKC